MRNEIRLAILIIFFYRGGTVELSRRSVARDLPFLQSAFHVLRSALMICSTSEILVTLNQDIQSCVLFFLHSSTLTLPGPDNCSYY
jgi:hypothetical protein